MTYSAISIIVVEDNPGDARLLCEMLGETEYSTARCHIVSTLKEAREAPIVHASVATVLLDLHLPDSDGIDTLIGIREAYPDSAIIITTGLADEEMAIQALRDGAQNYMIKNEINANRLGRTLRYSIERHGFIKRLREEEQRSAELRANEHSMRHALERERELNAMKSRFVSLVSHEFRTPLAIIQGSVDLIDRYAGGPDAAKVHGHVSRIQMKVQDLTAMLSDVLSAEKLDQDALKCVPMECDIVKLCDEVLTDMRSLAAAGQRLNHERAGNDPIVFLDPQMITNVLTNLLSNAIKYSPTKATITLRTVLEENALKLSVQDEGIGIPEEEQGLLFERFFRGSNVSASQGTGLGLSIVKQYLDLMGGHIDFTSVPGKTLFQVELPRRMPTSAMPMVNAERA
jgi:signal transduction histidine kinase